MKGEQRLLRPWGIDVGQLNPFKNVEEGVSGQEKAAGADKQEVEEFKKQVKDLEEVSSSGVVGVPALLTSTGM